MTATAPPPAAPVASGAAVRWTGRSRGGRFGNWWFLQLIRRFGLWPAYLWLAPVAAYFTLASPGSYRSSVDYLRRVLGPRPFWMWPFLVYRHFVSQGISLLDRAAVIMGRSRIRCTFDGEARVREAMAEERGVILLAAHVGSWEIGGHLLARHGRPVNVIVLERDAENIRQLHADALRAKRFQILTATDDPLRSVAIVAALRRGELVAMHGDRVFGGASMTAPFLGSPAAFPVGAYMLAAATGAPILHVFAVRERLGHYRFLGFPVQHVPRRRGAEQAAILEACVRDYVAHVESVVKQYPFQWYNFYPFWAKDETKSKK